MKKKQKDIKLEFVITRTLHARNGLGMIKQTWWYRALSTGESEFTPPLQFSYQDVVCEITYSHICMFAKAQRNLT